MELVRACMCVRVCNEEINTAAAIVLAAHNKSHWDIVTAQGKLQSCASARTHKQKNNVVIMSLTNILIYTFYMEQNMKPAVSGFDKC